MSEWLGDYTLVPLPGQGDESTVTGLIRKSGFSIADRLSRYRVTKRSGRQTRTVAYLTGPENSLERFPGRRVKVTGRTYWLQGQPEPLMVVTSIRPFTPVEAEEEVEAE